MESTLSTDVTRIAGAHAHAHTHTHTHTKEGWRVADIRNKSPSSQTTSRRRAELNRPSHGTIKQFPAVFTEFSSAVDNWRGFPNASEISSVVGRSLPLDHCVHGPSVRELIWPVSRLEQLLSTLIFCSLRRSRGSQLQPVTTDTRLVDKV